MNINRMKALVPLIKDRIVLRDWKYLEQHQMTIRNCKICRAAASVKLEKYKPKEGTKNRTRSSLKLNLKSYLQ